MLKLDKLFHKSLLFLALASIGIACKDEEAPVPSTQTQPEITNAYESTNTWIYDVMKEVYLWTDEMPASPDKAQDPEAFFGSLKSSKDRFSFIVPDYQALIKSLSGVSYEAGYEFTLTPKSKTSDEVWAFVLYTKPNSPAQQAGLQRGDIITHINGQGITRSNYKALLSQISSTHSIDYQRYNSTTQQLEVQPQLSLNTLEIAENPNFMHKVITTASGKKVGYYVYNFFSPGTGTSNEYDAQMEQIIGDFKSQGINELVLDLRYNSGGRVSSATNLASLIGKGVGSTKIFYQYQWNTLLQNYFESKQSEENLRGRFLDKSVNIGNNLSSGTVYILTDQRTASASELIINGLKPYMNVVLIGYPTVGKNVGSFPIEDKENPENKYGLLPIVFQISNSQGSSDYAQGFAPNYEVGDLSIPMKALGDVEEPMLAQALALIEGNTTARTSDETIAAPSRAFTPIGSSLERKAWTDRIIIDDLPLIGENPF